MGDDALAEIFSMSVPALVSQFDALAGAPGGVARLRDVILSLAVRGKLTAQHPTDEPAHVLLQRIQDAKALHVRRGGRRAAGTAVGVNESDFEVLDSLPPGWVWSSLSSIGLISPRNEAEDAATASFVPMSAIPVAFTDAHETESRPWRDIKSGFTHFAEGDVGVAKITPCFENGKSAVFKNLCNGVGAGTTELYVVRPLCGVMPRYVLLFLKSPGFIKGGEAVMTGTAGQKRLPRAYFEDCPFPLPPLAEQARIVARVDELMQLCDALEAKGRLEAQQHARLLETLLGTLTDSTTPEELAANWQRVAEHFDLLLDRPEAVDALEQTLLALAIRGRLGTVKQQDPHQSGGVNDCPFTLPTDWKWTTLADLQPEFQNGASSRGDEGGRPTTVIRLADIKDQRVSLSNTRQVPIREPDTVKYRLRDGDILITRVNGSADIVGQFNLVEGDPQAIYCDHFIRMRVRCDVLDPRYLTIFGATDVIRGRVRKLFISTAGQKTVNQGHIGSLPVAVPPLGEQVRIVARVTELRRLCADLRQRLAASQATQSRLAEALVESALA